MTRMLFTAFLGLLLSAVPGLILVAIIFGGVRSGIFTASESSCIAVIYAIVVTILVYRSLPWSEFVAATLSAVRTSSMVLLVIGSAAAFGWLLAYLRVPADLVQWMKGLSENPIVILLLLNVLLLFLGTFMDMSPLIVITTPIFLPVARELGMDPLQFAMLLMMNLGLGLCTPPVGACLFVGCAIGEVRMEKAVRTIWPFYLAILVALMLTTFVPAVSLTLPGLLE